MVRPLIWSVYNMSIQDFDNPKLEHVVEIRATQQSQDSFTQIVKMNQQVRGRTGGVTHNLGKHEGNRMLLFCSLV